MIDEIKLYRVLARGLLDIRIMSHMGDSAGAFHIADLLHNIPLQMERVRGQNGSYSDILAWLEMRAEQKKMTKWLDRAVGYLPSTE